MLESFNVQLEALNNIPKELSFTICNPVRLLPLAPSAIKKRQFFNRQLEPTIFTGILILNVLSEKVPIRLMVSPAFTLAYEFGIPLPELKNAA